MGSGCPAATNEVHVPAVFAHDLHGVVQAFWQQVASTQYPEAHSVAPPQEAPTVFRHTPAPSLARSLACWLHEVPLRTNTYAAPMPPFLLLAPTTAVFPSTETA